MYPGVLGDAIYLMLTIHDLTREKKYLNRADKFGNDAVEIFFKDSPLPGASSMHDYYKAVTRSDMLFMSLMIL